MSRACAGRQVEQRKTTLLLPLLLARFCHATKPGVVGQLVNLFTTFFDSYNAPLWVFLPSGDDQLLIMTLWQRKARGPERC